MPYTSLLFLVLLFLGPISRSGDNFMLLPESNLFLWKQFHILSENNFAFLSENNVIFLSKFKIITCYAYTLSSKHSSSGLHIGPTVYL